MIYRKKPEQRYALAGHTQDGDHVWAIQNLPLISTMRLSPVQRAIGRFTRSTTTREPQGHFQLDLVADLFLQLYQSDPQMMPPEDMPPERMVNAALLEWAASTFSWNKVRSHTVANSLAAAGAAGQMWDKLMLEDNVQEAMASQAEAEQHAQAQEQAEAQAQAAAAEGDSQAQAEAEKQAKEAAEQKNKAAQKGLDQIKKSRENRFTDARVAAATKQAEKTAKDLAEAANAWGLEPGDLQQMSPEDALEFMRKHLGQLEGLAELVGRLKSLALNVRQERVQQGHTITGSTHTKDLRDMFPSEAALLAPQVPGSLRVEKVAQWQDGGLLGYKKTGTAKKAGPFILFMDKSGSMGFAGEKFPRDVAAKGVALGLAKAAQRDAQRDFVLGMFDHEVRNVIDSHSDWRAIMKWAGVKPSGGTDFNEVFPAVIELVERWTERFGQELGGVDLVFISDGMSHLSEEVKHRWLEFAHEHGIRTLYVAISVGSDMGSLEGVYDKLVTLETLDEKSAGELTRILADWVR